MPSLSDHLLPFQAEPAYALALALVQDLERLTRYGRCYDLSGRRLTCLGQVIHAFNNGQLAPIFTPPPAELAEAEPLPPAELAEAEPLPPAELAEAGRG